MSNRTYLTCTNFDQMPSGSNWNDFFSQSGNEYEAKACIPIFWLLIFDLNSLKIFTNSHLSDDVDFRPYPYLICDKKSGVNRLKSKIQSMKVTLGNDRFQLYAEWIAKIEAEPHKNIIVRTEELDWMCSEGDLEKEILIAIKKINLIRADEIFVVNSSITNVTGLWNEDLLNECESYELVGIDLKNNWPQRYKQPYIHQEIKKNFWKKLFRL
jgi:hypothetical protein